MRHGPAIDGDDKAAAFLAKPDQRLARWAVSFEQAVGDIVPGIAAQHPHQPDKQGRAGCAVDVIVAVDGDLLGGQDGLGQPLGRRVHVAQERGIGQE